MKTGESKVGDSPCDPMGLSGRVLEPAYEDSELSKNKKTSPAVGGAGVVLAHL